MKATALAALAALILVGVGCAFLSGVGDFFRENPNETRLVITYATIKVIEETDATPEDFLSAADTIESLALGDEPFALDDLSDRIPLESLSASDRFVISAFIDVVATRLRELAEDNPDVEYRVEDLQELLSYVREGANLARSGTDG